MKRDRDWGNLFSRHSELRRIYLLELQRRSQDRDDLNRWGNDGGQNLGEEQG